MTITYQFDVSTSTFCGFTKLLTKWRGSIYKLVYQEMLIYTVAYTIITLAYRLAMTDAQKRLFEKVSLYCARYLDLIPLSFVLGFYVTFVVQRWWSQFTTIPWPDRIMNTVAMYVHGTDERGRLIRRTLMRYMNLSFVLVLSSISVAVKKRFPTLDHLVEAGFMTSEEKYLFNKIYAKVNKYWIPMCWFINLLEESRKEGRLQDGAPVKHILEEVNRFRSRTSLLWCFDWVTVPIVYTQVVTWATHLFFIVCLVGRQYLDPLQQYPGHDIDMYVPFFTLLQFFFYMGWLKVAEQLINPFGEDEDDFETNWLIDRHIQVSYLGVDELYGKLPRIQKDIFWDDNEPEVPYTAASLIHKIPNYCGSTMHLKIPGYTDVSVSETTEPTKSSNIEKTEGFFQRIKKNFSNRRNIEDSAGNKLWKKVSMKNLQAKPLGRRDTRDRTRTLGRRESLMGGEFLAMLNRGRKKRISDASIHSQILSRNNVLNENSSHHVITMDCPSSSEQNHGVLHYLFPSSRRGSLNPQISIDAVGDSDKDSLYNFREGDASSRRSSLGATPLTSNRSSDNGLFVSNVPKPYKSVFNEGHALRPLLARLSEIENENENESEVSSSSVPSPENNVINPEIGKKLESYNAHDSD